jgi:hypothetical protein
VLEIDAHIVELEGGDRWKIVIPAKRYLGRGVVRPRST